MIAGVERESLRRLGGLKLGFGIACAAVPYVYDGGLLAAPPSVLGAAVAAGALALLVAAALGRGQAIAQAVALLLELGAIAAVHHLAAGGALALPRWWDGSWLSLLVPVAVLLNTANAPSGLAFAAAMAGTALGWYVGDPRPAGLTGAAVVIGSLATARLRRHLASSHDLAAGAERAAVHTDPKGSPAAAPAGASVEEADLRAVAAMLSTRSLALLVPEPVPGLRWPAGELHVLQDGAYQFYRVVLDSFSADQPDGLGFVIPPGLRLQRPWRTKRLLGQAGEVGRLVLTNWPSALPGQEGGDSPQETLLALVTGWWSLRLDNRRLAVDAESRLLDVVESLVTSVEAKDPYTSGHSKRVCRYSVLLAEALGVRGRELDDVAIGAALHDVGKLGIPEQVLCKPTRLESEEWELVKAHPKVGARIIDSFNQSRAVLDIIFHHHERYDGCGYPAGLQGEAIPFHARIVGVADALDAMTSGRAYQHNRTVAEALEELWRNAGKQFDPRVVQAALRIPRGKFEAIAPTPPVPAPRIALVSPDGGLAAASRAILPTAGQAARPVRRAGRDDGVGAVAV